MKLTLSGTLEALLEAKAARLGISPQEALRMLAVQWVEGEEGWSYPADPMPELVAMTRAGRSVPGFVYLIAHLEDEGLYKIGFSVRPLRRMEELCKVEDAALEMVCTIPTSDMRRLERELHEQFQRERQRGEWFRLNEYQVAKIVALSRVES